MWWKKCIYCSFVTVITNLYFIKYDSYAQELYPLHEPASTLGKNTLGIRLINETYNEKVQWRNMTGLRLMYGVTPKLTVMATGIASNHHGEKFPQDFPHSNTPERGAIYPMRFNGAHFYGKYRFLTLDKPKQHLRLAAYAETTLVKTTHHESEPNLAMGDTKGWGAGIISTYLYHKFATSLTVGYIHPWSQTGWSPDVINTLPDYNVRAHYGKALTYGLSFGYLVLPKQYTSYKQTNLNVYLEFHGKFYGDGQIDLNIDKPYGYTLSKYRYPDAFRKGYYVDISPGLQAIINSNLRIDASVTLPLLGKSWARLYPVFTIAAQYYFYL